MKNVTGAASPANAGAPDAPSLKTRALDEMRKFAVITVYLWVLFAMFSLYRRMILQEHGISAWGQSLAIVNALVFAKVILIAQALHLEAGLRKYPRIFIVLANSLLFTIVLLVFHVLEEAIKACFQGLPIASSVTEFCGGTLSGCLTVCAIMLVGLIPFFGMQEISRAIGGQALWDLFLSGRTTTFKLLHE